MNLSARVPLAAVDRPRRAAVRGPAWPFRDARAGRPRRHPPEPARDDGLRDVPRGPRVSPAGPVDLASRGVDRGIRRGRGRRWGRPTPATMGLMGLCLAVLALAGLLAANLLRATSRRRRPSENVVRPGVVPSVASANGRSTRPLPPASSQVLRRGPRRCRFGIGGCHLPTPSNGESRCSTPPRTAGASARPPR